MYVIHNSNNFFIFYWNFEIFVLNFEALFALSEFFEILKICLIVIKAQGIQISLTKDRLSIYSIALIKKIIINLIYRSLLVEYNNIKRFQIKRLIKKLE